MNESEYLVLLISGLCIMFFGGFSVGFMLNIFRANERDSSRRLPRPGTEPTRPERFKPFRRHPDMLASDDETKNP